MSAKRTRFVNGLERNVSESICHIRLLLLHDALVGNNSAAPQRNLRPSLASNFEFTHCVIDEAAET